MHFPLRLTDYNHDVIGYKPVVSQAAMKVYDSLSKNEFIVMLQVVFLLLGGLLSQTPR